MELRPRQLECLDAILSNYVEGVRQQLVVKATGTGKAVVIANIKKKVGHLLPGKVLVFAHREELIDQLKATYEAWNPGVKVGKEMANDYADVDCDVIVSCVASIGRNGSTRLARFGNFDIVICDEAHHSIAQTYLNVFEMTGVLQLGTKKLLVGFTATPKRHNRARTKQQATLDDDEILSLKSVYQKVVFSYPIRKAIKEGWLVPLKGFRLKTDTNLDNVKVTAGDFQQDQLTDTINTSDRNAQILKSWLQYGEGRQTVGFTSGIEHAKSLADLFKKNGVKAEAVWGTDPERAIKLAKHKRKEITVLFNAQVLTEGYDDWQVSCIITAAPTRNSSKYTQEIGRGARLQEGAGNLLEALQRGYALSKRDCYVLDVVDNSRKCSLVTLPSLVGLNPEMDLNGGSVTEAAEKMEEMQEKYPTVDLSGITDITKVNAYIESIDLFAEPYTEEVKTYSKLGWVTAADGSYVLPIPERKELSDTKAYARYLHEKLHIIQNELDEFELSISTVNDDRKLGAFSTLQEAFETADDVIQRCRPDRMKLLSRDGVWREQLATEAVKKYLRSLSKKRPILKCTCPGYCTLGVQCKQCKQMPITAGEASTAINILKNSKK
jgi:superfamily II DNA or RNA helicase